MSTLGPSVIEPPLKRNSLVSTRGDTDESMLYHGPAALDADEAVSPCWSHSSMVTTRKPEALPIAVLA